MKSRSLSGVLLMVALLTGCSAGVRMRVPRPIVDLDLGSVWVRTEIGDDCLECPIPWAPAVEYADLNGGWSRVYGRNIDLEPGRSMKLRLDLEGRVVSAVYSYDGAKPRPIRAPHWQFHIRNFGDNGPHALVVKVRYQNPGQKTVEYTAEFMVYNTSRAGAY